MRTRRILIVDDDRLLTETLREMIADFATSVPELAFTVETIASGRRAAQTLEGDEAFDLVICDLTMPGVDGFAIYEGLLARRSPLVRRFVLVTGGAFTPAAAAAIERHALPCLPKPFDAAALAATLRAFV